MRRRTSNATPRRAAPTDVSFVRLTFEVGIDLKVGTETRLSTQKTNITRTSFAGRSPANFFRVHRPNLAIDPDLFFYEKRICTAKPRKFFSSPLAEPGYRPRKCYSKKNRGRTRANFFESVGRIRNERTNERPTDRPTDVPNERTNERAEKKKSKIVFFVLKALIIY